MPKKPCSRCGRSRCRRNWWRNKSRKRCWHAPLPPARENCRGAAPACGSCVAGMLRFRAGSEPDMTRPVEYKFLLYVAGRSENSLRAAANLTMLCQTYLADRHNIEVVDVFKEPKRALADDVLMTPMLIKLAPSPVSRIVGSLSNTKIVLESLGLASDALSEPALVSQALRPKSVAL